jgi:hypothetical protein
MQTKLHWCLIGVFSALTALGGCARNYAPDVARRASFDLGCEVTANQVEVVGYRTFGVVACGCRATYISPPESAQFVLNVVSGDGCHVTAGGEAPQPRR